MDAAPLPSPAPAAGALAGIRVLDLSRVLAGPWCTQVLADLGADVVKVERPGLGDDTRQWGPPFLKDAQGRETDQAAYFTACNRNKRSITIDMAHPEGQALIRAMALRADVVVENFKVGGLKQYGLDHESLRALNPRLIYCSVTGFGQDGPYAARAGYDLMVQALTGLMDITGRADGEPGGGPLRVGVAVIDLFTGLYASNAILAALHARQHTGEGQHIDMALLDVGMAVLANQAAGFLATGESPRRQGNSHPSLVPYQDFPHGRRRHAAGHRQRRPVRALLHGRRPAGMGIGRAVQDQYPARGAPRRTGAADGVGDPHAQHRGMGGAAGGQGRAVRADQ